MIMKKLNLLIIGLSVYLLGFAQVAYAQNPPRIEELGGILDSVFSQILPIGGLLAVGMIVYGGYMWLISGGDSSKIAQAQGTLTWAIGGLVFLVIFGMILKSVFDFLGN